MSDQSASRSLAKRYSPSTNEASKSLRRRGASAAPLRKDAASPGAARRAAAARLDSSRRSSIAAQAARQSAHRAAQGREKRALRIGEARRSHAERIEYARERRAQRIANARGNATKNAQADSAQAAEIQALRQRWTNARAANASLQKRMANASQGVSIASDMALKSAMGAAGFGGYGSGGAAGDRWGGYNHDYGGDGWGYWYWNSCWPYYSSWWFGCSSGWFPGWGWGWGYSYSWGYKPWWSWSCYWPSYYSYCWPTYAWWSPSVVYKVYEEPVEVVIVEEEEEPAVVAAPAATPPVPDVGQRAATEYMGLGDRAFTEGRYGDAVHYYAKAIEFAPQDGVLYLVLSDALFATGDYHYAAFALKRSLELHPELASLGLDKREFYGVSQDFDRHLVLLETFVGDHVIDEDARLILAANYLFSRQPERCVELLDNPFSVDVKASAAGQLLLAASLELATQ